MATTKITKHISLTIQDVEDAVRAHLKLPADARFCFNVTMQEQDGDWHSRLPMSPRFDGAEVWVDETVNLGVWKAVESPTEPRKWIVTAENDPADKRYVQFSTYMEAAKEAGVRNKHDHCQP